MNSKYCPNCGNRMTTDAMFCPVCGTKQISSNNNVKYSRRMPQHNYADESSHKKSLILLIVDFIMPIIDLMLDASDFVIIELISVLAGIGIGIYVIKLKCGFKRLAILSTSISTVMLILFIIGELMNLKII